MAPRSYLRRMLAAVIVTGLSFVSPAAAQPHDDVPSLPITGTLRFLGCTPAPEHFTLFAVPLEGGGADGRAASDPDGPPDREPSADRLVAELVATDDPHTFAISLPAVQLGLAYQLRIVAYPPNPCGRVFWEGPEQGIAYPGVPVRLVGYASRAQIEVMGSQVAGFDRRGWVGADTIDVQNPAAASRQLRWRSGVPGTTRGLIQVATEEFPKEAGRDGSCVTPPGLVHQATFAARNDGWNMLPRMNLAAIAVQSAMRTANPLRQFELFALGAPLYVRVLPMQGRTVVCDPVTHGPAPWVIFANVKKTGGIPITFASPGPPPPKPIELTSQSHFAPATYYDWEKGTLYRIVKPHPIPADINACNLWSVPTKCGRLEDPFAFQIAKWTSLNPGDTVPVGYHFWFKPGSDGFDIGDVFEGAVKIVTGVVDAVGLLVNQASQAFESIKKAVAKVLVSAISATGLVKCEASALCQQVVATAINTGLMAAGMPPSLPNWDEVVDQGFEYFAAEVVTQAGVGNVPGAQEITKAAAKALVAEMTSQMDQHRGGGGSLPGWLTLDTGLYPAVLTLELKTQGLTSTLLFPNYLRFSDNPVMLGTGVSVPYRWRDDGTAGRFMKIPIVLRPNLAGFVAPTGFGGMPLGEYATALHARAWWRARVGTTPCVKQSPELMVKSGPLALKSTYSLPSLTYDPRASAWFPPFQLCAP
jgi:hypothetical protein